MAAKDKLTLDDCLKLYEEEGIMGLVEKVKELSFKAGYEKCAKELETYLLKWKQEGRREVVEWIQTHPGKDKHTWDEWFEWQAKLKEWRMK